MVWGGSQLEMEELAKKYKYHISFLRDVGPRYPLLLLNHKFEVFVPSARGTPAQNKNAGNFFARLPNSRQPDLTSFPPEVVVENLEKLKVFPNIEHVVRRVNELKAKRKAQPGHHRGSLVVYSHMYNKVLFPLACSLAYYCGVKPKFYEKKNKIKVSQFCGAMDKLVELGRQRTTVEETEETFCYWVRNKVKPTKKIEKSSGQGMFIKMPYANYVDLNGERQSHNSENEEARPNLSPGDHNQLQGERDDQKTEGKSSFSTWESKIARPRRTGARP